MLLNDLRARATVSFPEAVDWAISDPGGVNAAFEDLHRIVGENYRTLGFECHADCFAEVVPKRTDMLSLTAWSRVELAISGLRLDVAMRPFYLGAGYVHFEIRHDGPIPTILRPVNARISRRSLPSQKSRRKNFFLG